MARSMTLRELRKIVKNIKAINIMTVTASNTLACMVYRGGRTKDRCEEMTPSECSLLDVRLRNRGGHAVPLPGKHCS